MLWCGMGALYFYSSRAVAGESGVNACVRWPNTVVGFAADLMLLHEMNAAPRTDLMLLLGERCPN